MAQLDRRSIFSSAALTTASAIGFTAMSAGPSSAAVPAGATGVNVRDFGAKGDGSADDSGAVRAAIDRAAGDIVYFPSGTYLIDNMTVLTVADILLGVGAVLQHKAGATHPMFAFSGSFLRIRGGVLDGNKANQPNRPVLIGGSVAQGNQIVLEGVTVRDHVKACVYAQNFGGYIGVQNCLFTGQAEHGGSAGETSAIISVVSGQPGVKGLLRFNHNRAIGTNAPRQAGSNPGGVFFGPVTATDDGNLSTVEAIGNWFWGYGQNCAGNVIAPLHTYPASSGARYIGNYFEQSSFAAISAKSVQQFICSDNVVVNGQVSTANAAREGAINYGPSYHAGSHSRPMAVISGNVIDSPGGEPSLVQNGICVFGSTTSIAQQIVVSNNVITSCGMGILVSEAADITIDSNVITTTSQTAATGIYGGIRLDQMEGDAAIRGNRVVCTSGSAITAMSGMSKCRLTLDGNSMRSAVSGVYACQIRGAQFASLIGNDVDAATHAVTVRGDGTTKLGGYYWDKSNMIHAGQYYPVFAEIAKCYGHQKYTGSPVGVVVPGEVGTTYTQLNGADTQVFWMATALTSSAWRAIS